MKQVIFILIRNREIHLRVGFLAEDLKYTIILSIIVAGKLCIHKSKTTIECDSTLGNRFILIRLFDTFNLMAFSKFFSCCNLASMVPRNMTCGPNWFETMDSSLLFIIIDSRYLIIDIYNNR